MEIGVRDLQYRVAAVIDAVNAGERVTLTVDGEAVADIVARGRRTRGLPGALLSERLVDQGRAADPALTRELEALAGQTLARL
jgi:antitoxin (DNA-binding transcriptional repressor) of toxin-antitoxin stability system